MSTVFDEIKERIDLAEIIGRSVALKRAGSARFKGLCPFHQERTPSFYVNNERHRWHCFGCGKQGDCFDWLEEQGYTKHDAFTELAKLAGVRIDDETEERRQQERRLQELFEHANTLYMGLLRETGGRRAREYLRHRELDTETWDRFELGYAPTDRRKLMQALKKAGFTRQECLDSGLVHGSESTLSTDFFFNRVVFPIRNQHKRIIAFGGRSLVDEVRSKYLNTRESILFHKQEVLYGLDKAWSAISLVKSVIVVEGYFDVMMAHQHGTRNVVATLGTAVTESHIKKLASIADEIVLAMDADKAGQSATWRSLQKAEEALRGNNTVNVSNRGQSRTHTCDLKIMDLPFGSDPDELIRSAPETWDTLKPLPVVDYALERIWESVDFDVPSTVDEATRSIAGVLVWVSNPVLRARYIQRAAEILDVDESDVRASLRRTRIIEGTPTLPDDPPEIDDSQAWEDQALGLQVASGVPADTFQFSRPESKALQHWLDHRCDAGSMPPEELRAISHRIAPIVTFYLEQPDESRAVEVARIRCILKRRHLFAERAEVLLILNDADDATERATLAQRYAGVVGAIVASDAQISRTRSEVGNG